MLPIPVLDDETFQQIAEHARSMIPRLCPTWTDFNYHDPGITFLELFAFLKESQQYHLDQIGPGNQQKYLKLLGMTREHRGPAAAGAVITGADTVFLPRGVRLLAGDVPFETLNIADLSGYSLLGGFCPGDGFRREFDSRLSSEPGSQHLEVFGHHPGEGSVCYMQFKSLPDESMPLRLHFWIEQNRSVPRNPAPNGMKPLAVLQWEYPGEDGWTPFEVVSDETQGLLFSGDLLLNRKTPYCRENLPEEDEGLLKKEGMWIRVRMESGSYDMPPVITGLCGEMIPVVQQDTDGEMLHLIPEENLIFDDSLLALSGEYAVFLKENGFWREQKDAFRETSSCGAEFRLDKAEGKEALLLLWRENFAESRHLGIGDGFPEQTFELGKTGQLREKFSLLIAEADEPDAWSIWQQVESFDASGPEDRHYVLDEEAGTITFGDCIHGMAPEGEILIAAQAVTLGAGGNVKEERINQIHPEDLRACGIQRDSVLVRNPDDARGGRNQESMDACFARCRRILRQSERAVTYEDYERLVRETPGLMIAGCKAVPVTKLPRQDGSFDENCVTIVVEPFSAAPVKALSPEYVRNILDHLEGSRMLGTKISLISPEYVSITIYAEILSQPHYVDARSRIQAAIHEYFARGWEFGKPVRYSELYGIIDTLDCVQSIDSLTIDAQGRGITRSIGGDVILPFNGMAVLTNASCQVRPAE